MSDTGGWTGPDPKDRPDDSTPPAGNQMPPAPPPPDAPYQQQGWGPRPGYGKPGVIPLRPLTVGEILDGAITTMRRHPALVFGSSAVVAVIGAVLQLLASRYLLPDVQTLQNLGPAATDQQIQDAALDVLGDTALITGVAVIITVLTQTFLSGFLTVVIGKAVLGKPVTFAEAMAEAKPRFLPLLGATIVYVLLVAAGSVLCLIPGIWLYTLFGLTTPALVLERAKVGQALSRSRQLVSGSWWRCFGILLLAGVIATVLQYLVDIPFSLSAGGTDVLTGEAVPAGWGALLLVAVGQVIAQTIVQPFVANTTALLYIDQRMRKEGMDLQLARAAGTA
ncbi:glycerophosphoryl diester phosphodiesterase membrane domain-containing protein [Amycolatopsis methanolica]|uniref:Integral membrane protein n=1 Tax=Amycolatopsis methanolica 239 TaxID=1068978 RepID=A0A076MTN0_AMYME|nr:glycerophosphoryl diester phosphodiesterase membrane domain-containing protein [Amycolatopsis methanolica]AIJ21122.1 hypothetical protein AMETH_1030 [Amycolatopsis methanolica 239]